MASVKISASWRHQLLEDLSEQTKTYLDYRSSSNEIDSQDVTDYHDIKEYYQHQAKLFSGQRKRLASTEDLDGDGNTDTNLNNEIENKPTEVIRPVKLKIRGFMSPEEKGAKDSKKPEDWERKERKTVERIHGGAGKNNTPKSEEVNIKTTPNKKVSVCYKEVGSNLSEADTEAEQPQQSNEVVELVTKTTSVDTKGLTHAEKETTTQSQIKYDSINEKVNKGTSPMSRKTIVSSPNITNIEISDPSKPTLELIIGRKEVRTKEALATAESRLTLYGTKDVEISIKSQSHISVTTTRRDNSGVETSEKFDVGMSTTAGKIEKLSPEVLGKKFTENVDEYIIPPTNILDGGQKSAKNQFISVVLNKSIRTTMEKK